MVGLVLFRSQTKPNQTTNPLSYWLTNIQLIVWYKKALSKAQVEELTIRAVTGVEKQIDALVCSRLTNEKRKRQKKMHIYSSCLQKAIENELVDREGMTPQYGVEGVKSCNSSFENFPSGAFYDSCEYSVLVPATRVARKMIHQN